jgi:hypothetical protein
MTQAQRSSRRHHGVSSLGRSIGHVDRFWCRWLIDSLRIMSVVSMLMLGAGCQETGNRVIQHRSTRRNKCHLRLGSPTRSFKTLICRLFRDSVQFCSGLVDLVVCVGRHGGGGHRLTLADERFIGLVAEHIAQMGDHGAEFREYRRGEGTESEPGDGGRPRKFR